MSQQDVETVRGAYDAFNRGDIPAVVATYHEEIEWIEPGGGNAPSGTFRGSDSVQNDVFSSVPENFDEFTVEVDDARDEGDRVVVTGRFRGRNKDGSELDATFEHTNHMRDGKVARFENDVDREAWAQGWGGG
jgi:uncharacterized protein